MATQQQVAHYQAQAALARGYDDWLTRDDPANEPHDDDAPTRDDAEQAVMECGSALVETLADLIGDDDSVSIVYDLTHPTYDAADKPVAELLAVLITTPLDHARAEAAYELRQRLRKALQPRIDQTYSEMRAEYLASVEVSE